MKHFKKGFTLIEVLIAVLVLSVALGASLQAISSYTGFQATLKVRYYAHLIAWDVLMECYTKLRSDFKAKCDESGTVRLQDKYWDWIGIDQEGYFFKVLPGKVEIKRPLKIRTVKVYPPGDDNDKEAGKLITILPR